MKRNQGFTLNLGFSVTFKINLRADHPFPKKKQPETAKQLVEQIGTADQPEEKKNSRKTSLYIRCLFVMLTITLASCFDIVKEVIAKWDLIEPIMQIVQWLFIISRWIV